MKLIYPVLAAAFVLVLLLVVLFIRKSSKPGESFSAGTGRKSSPARELYDLVHEPMQHDMPRDEFLEAAGSRADSFVYFELAQLYDDGPVTVDDYARVLENA